jgi:hypothetical protein
MKVQFNEEDNTHTFEVVWNTPGWQGELADDYWWDFGDGVTEQGERINSHNFLDYGTYTVKARIDTVGDKFKSIKRTLGTAQTTIIIGEEEEPVDQAITLKIDPSEIVWETGIGIQFTVDIEQPEVVLPENAIFEWDFGDDAVEVTVLDKGQTSDRHSHMYTKNGNYEFIVTLKNGDTDEKIASVTSEVTINDLAYIHKTNRLRVNFWAFIMEEWGSELNGTYTKLGDYNVFRNLAMQNNIGWDLIWIGENSFETRFEEILEGGQNRVWEMFGSVSDDVKRIITITISWYYIDPNYNGAGKYWEYERELILLNVPLTKLGNRDNVDWYGKIEGVDVEQYILAYKYDEIAIDELGERGNKKSFFSGFKWDTGDTPKIEVRFFIEK